MYLVLVLFYVNFNNTLCGTILQIRKKHFIEIPGIDSSFPFAASLIATETTLSVFIINGRLITGMLSFPPIVSKNGVSTGPGHTIVTVVPVFFNSLRSALEKLST